MEDRSASMLELKALHVPHGHYDVAVLGGGLAGLSMAIQLKLARPETRVLVTDKRTEPAPEAAFKVGESSVEVGAHYYREVVGMRDHLEQAQLRKHGLRFLLPAGDNSDITKRVEFCTPAHLAAFTHQIDRGRFENELFRRCLEARRRGVPRLARAGRRDRQATRTRSSSARRTTRRASRPAGSSTRAAARTSCAASSTWRTTPATTSTRPGSASPAASTSRSGPTTRSG